MSVSPRTINENEYGAAFELTLSNPKMDKEVIVEKLHKTTPREPLANRLESAQKRRNSHLSEKKEKAQVKVEQVKSKLSQMEEELKQKALASNQERIKSAETKRKSLIDEKVVKARADVEKAKQLAKMKENEESTKLQETQKKILETQANVDEARKVRIQEKVEKCKALRKDGIVKPEVKADEIAIEKKLSKAEENRKKQIQERLDKCKVKAVKSKEEIRTETEANLVTKITKKLSNAQLNKDALQEQELARLREKHEKVEMVKQSKKPE